jgi:hypothetical protein
VQQSNELRGLLTDLRDSRSALDRLRVVAQAWRLLRELTPESRKDVVTGLGIEGAEEIVERLAQSQGGRTPLVLLEGLRALRHADPGEVRWLLKRLRDAGDRRELAIEGVKAAAQRVIIAPPVAVTPEPHKPAQHSVRVSSSPEPTAQTAPAPLPTPSETPPARTEVPRHETPVAVPAVVKPEPQRPQPSVASPVSEAAAAPVPPQPQAMPVATISPAVPPLPPAVPEPRPIGAVLAARPAAEALRRAAPPKPAEGAPIPRPAAAAPPVAPPTRAELMATLGRLPSDIARLSRLRALLAGTRRPWDPERLEVVSAFRDGWLRRRAVESLIEQGAASVPGHALALIARLSDEWDRLVCLDALARRGAVEKEAALGLVSSNHARRRIGRWRQARMASDRA